MAELEKIKSYVDATVLHFIDGAEFGLDRDSLALVFLLFGVSLNANVHGAPATAEALRREADMLEAKNGG